MGFLARASAAALILFVFCAVARAESGPEGPPFPGVAAGPPEVAQWRTMISPLTVHFSSDADHKPVVLLGI